MTDSEILWIRDEMLPSKGEAFDALAFGRSVAMQAAAQERGRTREACQLAATALTEWKRDFPESWGLVDEMALSKCARAAGA